MLTDGEVIELVGANRRDVALAAILQAYRRKVFGLAYSFVRNREAAEDVAQEVFIRVWRALPSFDARASLATWIYTIARNTSLSALRDRRREVQLEDPATVLDAQPAAGCVESGAEQAALMRLVEELPDRQRQVVLLYYLQEQSHEEVASMLAMPVGTVKTLLHRAEHASRPHLEPPAHDLGCETAEPVRGWIPPLASTRPHGACTVQNCDANAAVNAPVRRAEEAKRSSWRGARQSSGSRFRRAVTWNWVRRSEAFAGCVVHNIWMAMQPRWVRSPGSLVSRR